MTNFTNGKVTNSTVMFYRTGIPNSDKNFGAYTTVNYEMLRQITRYMRNKNGGKRQRYSLF
jgi:hypothetical protein